MATRRDAREWALQILYGLDLNPGDPGRVLEPFWRLHRASAKIRAFTEDVVRGVCAHRGAIDTLITRHAANWKLSRMAPVDRNIMRIAVYEMLQRPDIPAAVTINEAVDLAKYFNNRESGRFVNGILDGIRREVRNGNETSDA
jgi:N utilization substance protein B